MKQEIGLRIKEIRETMKMTKEQFGKSIGITGQYLGTVERGVCCLSLDKLEKLCNFTNLSADYILFGKIHSTQDYEANQTIKLSPEQVELGYSILEKITLFAKSLKENSGC